MADCREADLISGLIDGELSEREHTALELHLNGCRACREELRDMREVKALMASAPALKAPADLADSLVAQAVAARRLSEEHRRGRFPLWAGGLAAAASLVLWFGIRKPEPVAQIPLSTLVAAHHRQAGGLLHDRIESSSIYSSGIKGVSRGNA